MLYIIIFHVVQAWMCITFNDYPTDIYLDRFQFF